MQSEDWRQRARASRMSLQLEGMIVVGVLWFGGSVDGCFDGGDVGAEQ